MKKEQTALELIREASFETEPDRNNSDRAVNLTIAECMIEKAKKEEAKSIFAAIEKLKIRRGSHSMIDEEDYQQLKEQFLNEK